MRVDLQGDNAFALRQLYIQVLWKTTLAKGLFSFPMLLQGNVISRRVHMRAEASQWPLFARMIYGAVPNGRPSSPKQEGRPRPNLE